MTVSRPTSISPFRARSLQRPWPPSTSRARLGGDNDPWSPERSVWPLLQLVDEHLGDPLMRPLAAHLRASSPTAGDDIPRRFTAVRHLADLYDRYAVHRPGMLLAWERGPMNTLSSPRPEDMAWQAELWRLLRHRLGGPARPSASRRRHPGSKRSHHCSTCPPGSRCSASPACPPVISRC